MDSPLATDFLGQITGSRLLIFHSLPSCLAVTSQRLAFETTRLPSADFEVIWVTTSTLALPSSFHLCTPASRTVPVVGSTPEDANQDIVCSFVVLLGEVARGVGQHPLRIFVGVKRIR